MIHTILLDTLTPSYSNLIMIGVMVVIFYVFFIRPQQKKQKNQKQFTEGINKGDQVVTMGGIHGKVLAVEETIVVLEIDKGTKLKIEKSSVSMETSQKANS